MQLIPVGPAHIDTLSILAADCFTETFGHLYPPRDLETFLTRSYRSEKLLTETGDATQFWRMAVEAGGQPVGYLHCGPVTLPHAQADRAGHGELKRIYIRASHQGLGLGKNLLETALGWLSQTYGDAPQWLGVWSGNHRAQTLYAAYGFAKVGAYKFPVGETLDDEFILRRQPG